MNLTLEILQTCRVVGVLDVTDEGKRKELSCAMQRAGIEALLVQMSKTQGVAQIADTVAKWGAGAMVGAGGITDANTAFEAIDAGARFITTPVYDTAIFKTGNNLGVPVIPEVFSPNEVYQAAALGSRLVSLFPAGCLDVAYLEQLAQLPLEVSFAVRGGLSEDTAAKLAKAGASCFFAGADIYKKEALEAGRFNEIQHSLSSFLTAVAEK